VDAAVEAAEPCDLHLGWNLLGLGDDYLVRYVCTEQHFWEG
jgi:hypothetical protein